jgi:catechol 2,3-dioxygenase-like lactoylglutathione lyase family enzyme
LKQDKHVCQVGFVALDGTGLREWYFNVFGLVKSGKVIFFPPSTTRVQGVPNAWEKTSWLIDQQDYFQLEFFQFLNPRTRLKPLDWRPCDIGYNMVGIAVNDFDQVLRNICAFSAMASPPIFGEQGRRRACVADPEGNLVEVYECDPLTAIDGTSENIVRPEVPAVVRTMRASVPNLAAAREAFVDALGLQVVEGHQLHSAEDESMWGLEGAEASSLVLRASNFLLELVEYRTPQPRPWPEGYSLSDQGFMNIALGYSSNSDFDTSFGHATSSGMTPNGKVIDIGLFRVMYVNSQDGFSVEMLNARRAFWSISGFNSQEPYVENEIEINAPRSEVWRHLTDHASMGKWTLFKGKVLREGRDDPNGLGCIRELSIAGLRATEEVTAWTTDEHYAYQLRTGAPFCRHQGDIFVSERDSRTTVRWAIRFESWIPFTGKLIAWILRRIFLQALKKLKSRVEA